MNEIATETPAPPAAAPVSEAQRLKLIDALRGVALLGILLMNIPGFAMPDYFSESFRSDPANVNFWVSALISIVFEGKMRALFGMIFGAGVLLFVLNKERAGKSVTWLFYRRMIWLIGYGVGLPLVTCSVYHSYLYSPNLEAILRRMELVPIEWVGLIYPFQRILLVMAHVAALVLLYKSQLLQTLFRGLEAVGQMAFTNYIMHSVICTLFFFGYGLNYFAELEYYQVYFVAIAIWTLQLLASPLWLRFFLFGPLEWVWRSLTYWKRQPFLRPA